MTPSTRLALRIWPWLLAVVILGPALLRGYVLSYDMVFVPDLAFRRDFLGLGSGLPRAVPSDAVIAALDEIVPGMLLQKTILLLSLALGGVGARRLVAPDLPVAQFAAVTLYLWNPFVAERLAIGHWPLLMTYAVLPWMFDVSRRLMGGRGVAAMVLLVAIGSLSPAGGVIASLFAVLNAWLGEGGAPRRLALVIVGAVAVNLPWIVTGALHGRGALSDPSGVGAFATRGEGPLSAALTAVGLGGIWNAEVVPATRSSWPAVVALLLVVGVCAAGVASWNRWCRGPDQRVLIIAGAAGLCVALAGTLLPEPMQWLVSHVPGGGLLRDGARFVALLAPLQAALFGFGVQRLVEALRPALLRLALATLLVLAPIALMPDLAWGVGGRLQAADFPEEYGDVRAVLQSRVEEGRRGDLLVLPFYSYRLPSWNGGRRTLDPLGRFMAPNYVASDVLFVSGNPVAGEDERARKIERLLSGSADSGQLARELRELGIAWVLLDKEAETMAGGATPSAQLRAGDVIFDGDLLTVWELRGAVDGTGGHAEVVAASAAWVTAGGTVLGLVCYLGAGLRRSRPRTSVRR